MKRISLFIALISMTFFWGCASMPRYRAKIVITGDRGSNSRGKYELYQVGIASYYGKGYEGNKTANGEPFDKNAMTAAHRELPFDTEVRVTNIYNEKTVKVRINDRGPFKDNRIIDLSERAARELDMIEDGVVPVRLEIKE